MDHRNKVDTWCVNRNFKSLRKTIEKIQKGENLLLRTPTCRILMKNYGLYPEGENGLRRESVSQKGSILRFRECCQLKFRLEKELGLYVLSSSPKELVLKHSESEEESAEDLQLITSFSRLRREMKATVGEWYIEKVVNPFLERQETTFVLRDTPSAVRQNPVGFRLLIKSVFELANTLENGSFLYVGDQHAICVLGVSKDSTRGITQRTRYGSPASVIPELTLSKESLGGDLRIELEDKPFIFPQVIRGTKSWGNLYGGDIKHVVIINNISEALEHVEGTDFAYFASAIKRFAELVEEKKKRSSRSKPR